MSEERLRGERDRSIRTASRLAMDVAERDSLIEEYKAEIERLRIERDTVSKPLHAEIERLKTALEFYADPETYAAIAFLPDPPCGDFCKDFSDDHGHDLLPGFRPGKRARAALEGK